MDAPETTISEGWIQKMTRHVGRTDNDMDMVMREVDANMNDMNDQENITEVEVNNLINEVVTEVTIGELGADTMENRMEKLRKQHAEEIRKLKSGKHPPWFNAVGFELISKHDLEQDADDIAMEREAKFELELDEGYHQNRLQLSAIDALLHRVTDDAVLRWLHGGPRPRNAAPLSPGSRSHFTRGAARSMEVAESSRVRQDFILIQLDQLQLTFIQIRIRNFCMMLRKLCRMVGKFWTQRTYSMLNQYVI